MNTFATWVSRSLREIFRTATVGLIPYLVVITGSSASNVITYHNDANRTGWNSNETTLTSSAVSGSGFGLLKQISLDAKVDAQPLFVSGVTIGGSKHDVVYVATEGNTVYAIDATSGAILLQKNLGAPVGIPTFCPSRAGPTLGINSTPAIDPASKTIYVMAYVEASNVPHYYLHALGLTTLADIRQPTLVAATHMLADGSTIYSFEADVQRQRAALLLANGNIYAGFAGLCGERHPSSRGWLLGWNATSLAPLAMQQLINQVLPGNAPNDFLLTSIWMSGFGLSSANGDVFFATGNSDPSGTTYDNTRAINLSESVVKWSPSKGKVLSYFSPTDSGFDVATLDRGDLDFGAGGVMLLPKQPGTVPNLAVAAGKVGVMYLLNQQALGGEDSGHALGQYQIGECWCGPSYFKGSDGVGRVVSSGGGTLNVWKVQTSPTTTLSADGAFSPSTISTGTPAGFFTSVSSNGTAAGSAVIWAVGRPISGSTDVRLYAFDATTGTQLFSATAGSWPNPGVAANIVPTVANGKVFVASNGILSIFGLERPQ